MSKLKRNRLLKLLNNKSAAVIFTVIISLGVIAVGTSAWFSLAQNVTNDFSFEPYDVKLFKLDSDTDQPLANAFFDLYERDGTFVSSHVTDLNGEITVNNLDYSKKYYFMESKAPYGYQMNLENAKTQEFSPGAVDITVHNASIIADLTIKKVVINRDINGSAYNLTAMDMEFPFEFTVAIGKDDTLEYPFVISSTTESEISDYTYEFEDETTLDVKSSGVIKSGEKIYLRHNETAVISGIPALTHYMVDEKNYVEGGPDPELIIGEDFGCDHEETDHKHTKIIGYATGWAASGNNTIGNLRKEGSLVVFENRKITEDYELKISSLAVVDRILAHPDDIDHEKSFEVTVTVDEDNIRYFYEVIDLLDDNYDYYSRNDPGVPPPLATQTDTQVSTATTLQQPSTRILKNYGASVSANSGKAASLTTPYIHKPSLNERWPSKNGQYPEPKLSLNNVITVNLHHGSALIIYGIPTGTKYYIEQKDYKDIDGYMIDSTIKTDGVILPDLEVLDDPDTPDPKLLRVRADIYNYFTRPITRKIELKKEWTDENDTATQTEVSLVDLKTGKSYDSRYLTPEKNWMAQVEVPKYDENGELIIYGLEESPHPDYVVTEYTEVSTGTNLGITIKNTKSPGTVKPKVKKVVSGSYPSNQQFSFKIAPITSGAPMPENDILQITGEGISSFGNIVFTEAGTFEYAITEVAGEIAGYVYDDSVFKMVVTVKLNPLDNKTLIATSEYTKFFSGNELPMPDAPMLFQNTYNPTQNAVLTIIKRVTGSGADPSKVFTFRVFINQQEMLIQLKGGESIQFSVAPYTPYHVIEEDYSAEGYYTTSSGNTSGTVSPDGTTVHFVNTKMTVDPTQTGSLTVVKTVGGVGGDMQKKFRFTVNIGGVSNVIYLKHGEEKVFSGIPEGTPYWVQEDNYFEEGYETSNTSAAGNIFSKEAVAAFTNLNHTKREKSSLTVTKKVQGGAAVGERFDFTVIIGGLKHKISLADGESYNFTDIPVNTPYSITEDDYTSKGYVTTSTGSGGTILKEGCEAVFTNTKAEINPNEKGTLIISKKVIGRFVDITKKFHFKILIGQQEYSLYLRDGESYPMTDIPSGTQYTVIEDDYSSVGYKTYSDGASGTITSGTVTAGFVNEYTSTVIPEPDDDVVQVSGTKTWIHGKNPQLPKSIIVYVMNGSIKAAQKEVTAKDGWSYAFNLPKYDENDFEIVYTVSEEPISGYTMSVRGYDLINTFSSGGPKTGDEQVTWYWYVLIAVGVIGLGVTLFVGRKGRQRK